MRKRLKRRIGLKWQLIRAKDEGKIDSSEDVLEKLKETGFWISDDLYTRILREVGVR